MKNARHSNDTANSATDHFLAGLLFIWDLTRLDNVCHADYTRECCCKTDCARRLARLLAIWRAGSRQKPASSDPRHLSGLSVALSVDYITAGIRLAL